MGGHIKKLSVLFLLILFVSVISPAQSNITIRASSPFPKGHIITEAMENFKSIVEEETRGRIKVELLIAQDTEEEANEKCAKGIVDMQFTGGRALEVFAPQYFFMNAPFVLKDYEHFVRLMKGQIGEKAKKEILEKGNMYTLGYLYRGYRQTTSNKPILSLKDLEGLKLRLPVVPTWIKVWEALGTKPVPVTLAELYKALKDGTAEASEGDLTQVSGYKLYEVQSYLIITNHLVSFGWVHMYRPTFDKLSIEDQKLIASTVEKVCDMATKKLLASENDVIKLLLENGMKVIYLDAKTMDQIREKARPAVEELFRTTWPVTTWEEVLAQ
ncbi:MAG TPA: TRAP transporter substrate-binding protein [Dictyoglomaceae bacterium]|nr:TRAP transporter substrate-binding protein [Dictyoglomaceae bacterium]HOL39864.1 TRAP transporter substrate-binding protein [Dictyoglomaceae bacterium]HOP95555.1 TRAP transporter substrate-binding protein [Dictyoglomaceae bacterium]HPP16341.1 TRAP transporter substrate-binding protein [Dictyoglomaceae bacterium]HPU43411.1 TRAP transporter substrate-binding protein [Dictyoglomaceae bacterium]